MSTVVVHTGNILSSEHLKRRVNLGPQQELVDALKVSLQDSQKHISGDGTCRQVLECGDYSEKDAVQLGDDAREDLKVTVKIFLTDVSKGATRSAVTQSLAKLKLSTIDLILLSVPSNKLSDFEEAWRELEAQAKAGAVQSIGVSDFDLNEFEALYNAAQVKPSVNQVNLESCCVIPPELSDFAKKNNVQLLTHNDPRVMLEPDSVRDILSTAAPALKAEEYFASWLVRYTAMIKLRGVVTSRGFIFSVQKVQQ
ncbi:hypothetical protein RvY_02049 [Ramazzottius varieornatus]|uniref:GCS light chain n=1 Tax=Ramazzottius varieornatus TaxID=947166 RepID=A0A1D1UIE1_RAMVA|nr:hypothetical protein RvY_02049 [Ramazzottius varieornatus]